MSDKIFPSFASAYEASLRKVLIDFNCVSDPRGKKVKELINHSFVITNPYSNLFTNKARSIPIKYLAGELDWYFSGSNNANKISAYSKFWNTIQNDDGTINSAYGYLLFNKKNVHGYTQWQWNYESLLKDKNSRQAVMYLGDAGNQYEGNKDFVCTSTCSFLIRDKKLHFFVNMRSNDAIRGITFDAPFFLLLQQNMLLLLKDTYPELEMGFYYHNATSFHIYEKDFTMAERMLSHSFNESYLPPLLFPIINSDGTYNQSSQPIIEWITRNKL